VNRFLFTEAARSDLRRIDREQAMKILLALTRFGNTGEGDLKQLRRRRSETVERIEGLPAESRRLPCSYARVQGRHDPHRTREASARSLPLT
jgi:hypothetical protein